MKESTRRVPEGEVKERTTQSARSATVPSSPRNNREGDPDQINLEASPSGRDVEMEAANSENNDDESSSSK